jgi:hypothetical protein
MALQTSGPIYLSQIQTEFGGSNPIYLNEYYGKDTVPASGPITLGDFYGTSSAYSIVGNAVPDTYTYLDGMNTYSSSVLGTVTDGNINTYVGGHTDYHAGWPSLFNLSSEAVRIGVQDKIGTGTPTVASFDHLGNASVTVTGWVLASAIGTINATLDGAVAVTLLGAGDEFLESTYLSDGGVSGYNPNGSTWQWCSYDFSLVVNTADSAFRRDKIARWIHNGCKVKVERGQRGGAYVNFGDVSDVSYALDFSVS